jgi:hypothetical protein
VSELALQIEPSLENELRATGDATILTAKAIKIADNAAFEGAGKFLVEIKQRAKRVEGYWKPLKEKARSAWQDVVDKEKAMLSPLSEAEAVIKREMVRYSSEQEAIRRAAAAEARRRQREESDRLLAEAIAAEKSGNAASAAASVAMAEMVEEMAAPAVVAEAPKAVGVSVRKTWKARIIDSSAVPINANGVEIRPINMSALDGIARLTKGTASIPGVEFYEESTIGARV